MNLHNKKGFTLVEILVVAAIIGVLASIVFISVTTAQSKSRFSRVIGDMQMIGKAAKVYSIDHNSIYPNDVNHGDPTGSFQAMAFLPNGWPKAPCADFYYDYNNTDYPGCSTLNANGALSVTYKKCPPAGGCDTALYFYKISKEVCPYPNAENILNVANKEHTCNE